MTRHLPALIVVLPLAAAFATPLLVRLSPTASRLLVLLTLGLTLAGSALCLGHALAAPVRYSLGGWPPPWGVELAVDALSGLLAVLVSLLALLSSLHAGAWRREWGASRQGLFDALSLLLVTGLLGMVVTADLFNLYVFLEISSLAGYALLALGGDRARVAVFRYLLVGTIAASFYLLGVGFLYALTGTLNMGDMAQRLALVDGGAALPVAVALIVVGLSIKAALFPLHGWLPDAYACASPAVTPFIAGAMSKVSVYALIRILFFVLPAEGGAGLALDLLGLAAAVAIVAGGLMALAQTDVNRLLAYSSIGQMGYIFAGLALGNVAGLTGALLHLVNHAVAKACLFMVGGTLHRRYGLRFVADYAGAASRSPAALLCLVVAASSLVGLPPFGGFFSKWYLLLGALDRGAPFLAAAIVASSLISAAYFFRLLEASFLGTATDEGGGSTAAPASRADLVPAVVLCLVILGLGTWNQELTRSVLYAALPLAPR